MNAKVDGKSCKKACASTHNALAQWLQHKASQQHWQHERQSKALRGNIEAYSVPAGPSHPATPKDEWCLLKARVCQQICIGDQVEQQIHTLDSSFREEQNGTPLLS